MRRAVITIPESVRSSLQFVSPEQFEPTINSSSSGNGKIEMGISLCDWELLPEEVSITI